MDKKTYKETFSQVRSSYVLDLEDFQRGRGHGVRFIKKALLMAAAVAVLAAFGITAMATGFFGLKEQEDGTPDIPKSPAVEFAEGFCASAEGKAWNEYVSGELSLAEAAKKYGLSITQRCEILSYEELSALQGGGILGPGHVMAAACVYDNGAFGIDGEFTSQEGVRVTYKLARPVKGYILERYMGLAELEGMSFRSFEVGEREFALIEGGGVSILTADLDASWATVELQSDGLTEAILRELAGTIDWDRLTVIARPIFPDRTQPVEFGAGVELLEENIIKDQSFSVYLAGLGRTNFISYAPTEAFSDVRFFFSTDGRVSDSELHTVCMGLAFERVAAVSFEDLTGDGIADILLLIDYRTPTGERYRDARIFTALGNGVFELDSLLSGNIKFAIDNSKLDAAAVRKYLRSLGGSSIMPVSGGYAGVLRDNVTRFGTGYFTNYTVFDLTGDGQPELIAGEGESEADAEWSVWTLEDGEAKLLGRIPAGHAVLYEKDGELIRLTGQMGVELVDKVIWNGESLAEESISERELGPKDSYIRPGRELVMMPADDPAFVESLTVEELICRVGKLCSGAAACAQYAMYDMNGDGSAELILHVDSAGGNEFRFYTVSGGRALPLGTVPASDSVLIGSGTMLYLLETRLEWGRETLYTVTYTDALHENLLSTRQDLFPGEFTDPAKLGETVVFNRA